MREIRYVGLHCHSTGSVLDGYGTPEQHAARVVELGQAAASVTDHGTISQHFAWQQAMLKRGVRPILGIEFYLTDDVTQLGTQKGGDRREGEKKAARYAHLTVLAQSRQGYQNLLRLVSRSHEHVYYKPQIDIGMLAEHQEGLVVLSGCVIGRPSQLVNAGHVDLAAAWLTWLRDHVEQFYCEIVPCPALDLSEGALPILWRLAHELRIPTVVTDDAHAPRPEDMLPQDTLLSANTGQKIGDANRSIKLPPYHYRCDGAEVLERCRRVLPEVAEEELVAAVERTVEIAEQCVAECPKGTGVKFTVPEGVTAKDRLYETAISGLEDRLETLHSLSNGAARTYYERLEHELKVICEKGFADYILIVADLVREMRSRGILVTPRGSAGGSLLLWALNVTIVDPIQHALSFDRFLDTTRVDPPDIDLDLQHDRRHEAFDYLEQKYGRDHVAHVATLSRFGARQALLDTAKVHDLPADVVAIMAHLVPEGQDADAGLHDYSVLTRLFEHNEKAQACLKRCPLLAIAAQLEGQVRQLSVHAGGALLDDRPLTEIVAVSAREGRDRVALVDMATAAQQNLLKIDLLGSKTLTALAECARELGHPVEWVYSLPLEDAAALRLLAEGRSQGVFQLGGNAASRIMRRLQPETFDDLVAVSALARPGPIQSGSVKHFVARRSGAEAVPDLHPGLAEVLGPTHGIVLFQEQGMGLATLAGFELADVHKVRKLISKIGGADALGSYLEPLALGWFAKGVPVEQIEEAYRQLHKAANYAFPKAHAVQYGYISAFTAYLKAHHPEVFTAASCRNVGGMDPEEQIFALLRDFCARGGTVELLSCESGTRFEPTGAWAIRGGWSGIKGVGEKVAAKIEALKPFSCWDELLATAPKAIAAPVAALIPAGCYLTKEISVEYLRSDVLQSVAPWFPLRPLSPEEAEVRNGIGAVRLAEVPVDPYDKEEITVVGRITARRAIDLVQQAKKYGGDPPAPGEPSIKAQITLTDETGSLDLGFSAKIWSKHRQAGIFSGPGSGLGNTLAVNLWWSADFERWYAKRAIRIREWQPWRAAVKGKKATEDEGA